MDNTLLEQLADNACWQRFYNYKKEHYESAERLKELEEFITNQKYLSILERIRRGEPFPLPRKAVINKVHSQKKRVVYVYPADENIFLKALTHLLLREYDDLFAPNLYSFRPGRSAKDAVRRITRTPGIGAMYSYKADISNYFNSVDLSLFLPVLENILADDQPLLTFLTALLREENVIENGSLIKEQKGIMAGTPLACFYANIFLREMDFCFWENKVLYARYSDDIIIFAEDAAKMAEYKEQIRIFLKEKGLVINPEKEIETAPGEKWTFLGCSYQDGTVDISPISVLKLKAKMRRKRDALQRWRKRKGLDGWKAGKAFIRVFNRKLYDNPKMHDLTWARWYFPVITTPESLRELDHYAEDCVRYLVSGRHTKARFNVRYADLKEMGFRSLVHEYYAAIKDDEG